MQRISRWWRRLRAALWSWFERRILGLPEGFICGGGEPAPLLYPTAEDYAEDDAPEATAETNPYHEAVERLAGRGLEAAQVAAAIAAREGGQNRRLVAGRIVGGVLYGAAEINGRTVAYISDLRALGARQ